MGDNIYLKKSEQGIILSLMEHAKNQAVSLGEEQDLDTAKNIDKKVKDADHGDNVYFSDEEMDMIYMELEREIDFARDDLQYAIENNNDYGDQRVRLHIIKNLMGKFGHDPQNQMIDDDGNIMRER